MLVNPVNGTSRVNSQERVTNPKSAASSARNRSTIPRDTVTLSPAAEALQTEQKLAAAAAKSGLSPAAEALQTEQKLADGAATLWRSALALISE